MDVYWSVERCRWEPCSPETDLLTTPWSAWSVPQPEVPLQRAPDLEPAAAEG